MTVRVVGSPVGGVDTTVVTYSQGSVGVGVGVALVRGTEEQMSVVTVKVVGSPEGGVVTIVVTDSHGSVGVTGSVVTGSEVMGSEVTGSEEQMSVVTV